MASEGEKVLSDFLHKLQSSERIRGYLALLLLLILLSIAGRFVYDLLPREYSLTITGGDMMGNRHFLAKLLQEEGAHNGLSLRVLPTSGSIEALEAVDSGKIDVAIIQGGLDAHFANIVHVATVSPELVHFLIKPEIAEVKDLHGRLINLGGKGGGTRVIARQILRYSNLEDDVDYSESNFSNEELIAMRPDRLPDVIVVVSFAPAFVADFFVKERGYRLLEMPFPESLALRLGWVADSTVLAYTYSVAPPVPSKDIKVIGVNSHVVAHRSIDPRAIFKVLDTLYGPNVENRFRQKFDESKQLTMPSGFELSEGTELFRERKDPLLSSKTLDKLKSLFGLVMSVLSTFLVLWRWFRHAPKTAESDDKLFKAHIKEIVAIDERLAELGGRRFSDEELAQVETQLGDLHHRVTRLAASAKLDDPGLVRTVLLCATHANERVRELQDRARRAPERAGLG
jgi:TRAP-type uncharacterized transport system substrate-binding protein